MRVAHRKFVESRAQKRTNAGGIWPDGCGVPPLRRSAFARLCVPPCSRTDRTPCQHPEGMDHSASVLFLLQMTRHLVAAREQGRGGGRRTEGLWLRTSVFDLPASSG